MSFIRLRIWLWIETSSAESGSSATISSGSGAKRAGDGDALALAAGEFVRVAVQRVLRQADLTTRSAARARRSRLVPIRWIRSGSAMMAETGMRGSSAPNGSWKHDLDARGARPGRAAGRGTARCPRSAPASRRRHCRACSCRCRFRRRAPASRPASSRSSRPRPRAAARFAPNQPPPTGKRTLIRSSETSGVMRRP